jgi:hypothetical protein
MTRPTPARHFRMGNRSPEPFPASLPPTLITPSSANKLLALKVPNTPATIPLTGNSLHSADFPLRCALNWLCGLRLPVLSRPFRHCLLRKIKRIDQPLMGALNPL